MATPQDLLMKAKGRMAGGTQPNTGGSRGAPGRGGIAARPAVGGGLQARPSALGSAVSATGAGPGPGGPPRPGAEPALDGGMVSKPYPGGPGAPPPGKPAWQQLQEAGIGGQGSTAANKAKLAEMQLGGGPGGSGGIMAPDQMPGGAPDMPVGSPAGGPPTISSFPGFKPRPGAEPALVGGPAPFGGPRPQGRMPVDNVMDMDGPPTGPPGGGGGGFGDIAAVAAPFAAGMNRPGGANVANRFQPPRAMPTYHPLR